VTPLSPYAIDYIEKLREKRPKRDVELKLRLALKYLVSNISTSHLQEVSRSYLPPQLRSEFEKIRVVREGPPESLIVYSYDPEFSPSRENMWILSARSGARFLSLYKGEREYPHRIPYDDWVHDFLPKLKAYTTMIIEVPMMEAAPTYEPLVKAVEELRHGEKFLREGNYDGVIRSVRNIVLNHLLTVIESVEVQGRKEPWRFLDRELEKRIIANIPREAESAYRTVLHGIQDTLRRLLQDHLSKFIHLDTQELIRMPLRADAEYLFSAVANIIRYLSKLSLLSPKYCASSHC